MVPHFNECVKTSSRDTLDAVSDFRDLRKNDYEGQPAIELEGCADALERVNMVVDFRSRA